MVVVAFSVDFMNGDVLVITYKQMSNGNKSRFQILEYFMYCVRKPGDTARKKSVLTVS